MRNPQDWGQPCPHPVCTHSRRLPQENGRALATSLTHSGTRRLLRCHPCETPVSETRAPVFVALRTSEATGMLARTRLLVRGALAGLSCGRGGTEEPGLAWRRRAASQADACNHHRRPPRPVTQGQREAMGHLQRTPAGSGDGRRRRKPARQRGWAPRGRGQLCARVALDAHGPGGTTDPRHRPGGRGGHAGTGGGPPGGLQHRLPGLSGGPERGLPGRDDVCAPWEARAAPPAPRGAPSRFARRALGPTAAARHGADTQPARRGWPRTPAPSGPAPQHSLGRTGPRARAAGPGPPGAEDVELVDRPRAAAAAGGLCPGLRQEGQPPHARAAAVGAARADTPWSDSSPRAAADSGEGGRPDGSRLDLS